MLDDELELADAGAAAIVSAMALDDWQATRGRVMGLFARSSRPHREAVEAQLDDHTLLVRGIDATDQLRTTLVLSWRPQLISLLHQEPEARAALEAVVRQIQAMRDGQATPSQKGVVQSQTNIARDNSRIFAAQFGNVIVHPTRPEPGLPR